MEAKDLNGVPVVSIRDAVRLGWVEDVLMDPEGGRMVALHIKDGSAEGVIPFDQVHSVGSDVVTVPSADVVQRTPDPCDAGSLVSLRELSKFKVVDEAGTALGMVRRVAVDPTDGHITEVQTQRGDLFGLGGTTHTVTPDEITSVGEQLMVVQAPEAVAQRREAAEPAADTEDVDEIPLTRGTTVVARPGKPASGSAVDPSHRRRRPA